MKTLSEKKAYQIIAKHIYIGYRTYTSEKQDIIILADDLESAKLKASEFFNSSLITVKPVTSTADYQIYNF